MEQTIEFELHIAPEEYLKFYQGAAKSVIVTATNGKTLKFPAALLQRYITHDGISGRFLIIHDDGKFKDIKKL